jgi:hypothetical protein
VEVSCRPLGQQLVRLAYSCSVEVFPNSSSSPKSEIWPFIVDIGNQSEVLIDPASSCDGLSKQHGDKDESLVVSPAGARGAARSGRYRISRLTPPVDVMLGKAEGGTSLSGLSLILRAVIYPHFK